MACQIKDTKVPDGNGARHTSPAHGTEWLIVYTPGVELILYQKNREHKTSSEGNIETFVSPTHAECRIVELGFTVPPEGWQGAL